MKFGKFEIDPTTLVVSLLIIGAFSTVIVMILSFR
jgi:hypothetical protein